MSRRTLFGCLFCGVVSDGEQLTSDLADPLFDVLSCLEFLSEVYCVVSFCFRLFFVTVRDFLVNFERHLFHFERGGKGLVVEVYLFIPR